MVACRFESCKPDQILGDFISEVYYRVIQARDRTIKVVCLQDFDEYDYDQKRFLTTEKFGTEDEAYLWIDKVILAAHKIGMR